jgi:Tol biopolymer transport system component
MVRNCGAAPVWELHGMTGTLGGTMTRTKHLFVFVCALALFAAILSPSATAQTKRAITLDDLIGMHRVSDPKISPDSKWVSYTVTTPDKVTNRSNRNVWLAATAGGDTRQLTRSGRDGTARWSPDGKRLAFISSRDGTAQIYVIALEGGEATKISSISTGVDWLAWSPNGESIAFTSRVYPTCKDDACNAKRDKDAEASKVKARMYDNLLYRHWTEWWDYKRSHLFVMPAAGGAWRDLTEGADYDVPPVQRGGPEAIAWSPDSKELCFTAVTDKMEAISTDANLFTVPVAGGAIKKLTTNAGFDSDPVYSPDGKWIGYRSQPRAGYEADKWRVMIYDRSSGTHTDLTTKFDRSAEQLAWTPDSKTVYFNGEDRAQNPIFSVGIASGSEVKTVVKNSFNGDF